MARNLENLTIAVVGATGAVGREMVNALEHSNLNVGSLRLLASERSAGERIDFKDGEVLVEELTESNIEGIDIALFSAGSDVSKEYGPKLAEKGTIVIDNSSCFRMDPNVPLVVPEVNASVVQKCIGEGAIEDGFIIANPNCSTIQLVVVLKPFQNAFGVERVVVSTYQSVSGAGKKAMDELWEQTRAVYTQQDVKPASFPHQIAFNVIPHIDVFQENGYTKEEMKMIWETRKILEENELRITTTAVRVPVFSCHSESVNIETSKPCSSEDAKKLLRESPGIVVIDEPSSNQYPMGAELAGTDATYVGRIRQDESVKNGINLWVVADNLRKGAALNAVQIAEVVVDSWGTRH